MTPPRTSVLLSPAAERRARAAREAHLLEIAESARSATALAIWEGLGMLAAIGGLAASRNRADAPLLRSLVEQGGADRRRAAAWALGEMQDPGSIDVLATALSTRDDRLVGDAAWALGEILVAAPKDGRAAAIADRWLYLGKHAGWAAAINSTAGLARLLWTLPRAERTALLTPPRRAGLQQLAFHKSRLVRINATHALASLGGDDDAMKALGQLLREDSSVNVKIAAARARPARRAEGRRGAEGDRRRQGRSAGARCGARGRQVAHLRRDGAGAAAAQRVAHVPRRRSRRR
jgi:HEAT repeat protein